MQIYIKFTTSVAHQTQRKIAENIHLKSLLNERIPCTRELGVGYISCDANDSASYRCVDIKTGTHTHRHIVHIRAYNLGWLSKNKRTARYEYRTSLIS